MWSGMVCEELDSRTISFLRVLDHLWHATGAEAQSKKFQAAEWAMVGEAGEE